MSSNSDRSSKCQICGLCFSNDTIMSHEISCLVRSQEIRNLRNSEDKDENLDADNESSNNSSYHTGESEEFYSFSEKEEDDDDDEIHPEENSYSASGMSRLSETDFSSRDDPGNLKNNPGHSHQQNRSSLVTPTFRYDRTKPKNLFPPTKKHRYYPITCEYCLKRFQPNKLKAHHRKRHLIGRDEVKPARRVQSAASKMGSKSEKTSSRSKSVGGIPRSLQVCYICGQLYGSKSIKIHEPKCLDKWRIQNEQLPPELRAPEPIKPEPISVASRRKDYDVPGFDPAAEAAFRSHLSTLVPCKHCSRTFSPDRIQKHMSCCIDRPRTRECVTPAGGEIPR